MTTDVPASAIIQHLLVTKRMVIAGIRVSGVLLRENRAW